MEYVPKHIIENKFLMVLMGGWVGGGGGGQQLNVFFQ